MESLSVLAGLVTTETLRDITAQGLSQLDFKRPVFIAFGYGFSKTLALVLYTAKVARKSYFTGQTTVRRKKKRRINSVPGGEDMNPVNANTHLLGNSCSPQSSYAAATVTASGVDAEGLLDPPEIPAPKVEFSTLLLLPIVPAFFDVLSTFFSFIYIFFLPSVVQLLEPGVELLFAALFAYLLRHRRLSKNHLAAFGVAFLAMLIVAACDATHFREETFDPFIEYEGAGSFASYTTTRSPSLSPTVSSVPSAANRSMPSSQSPSFTYNRFSSFVYRDAFIHTRGDEASITQRSDVHAASPIYTHTDMPSHISSRTTMNTHTDGDLPNQESPRRRYRQDKTNNADIDAHVRVDVVKMSAALMLVLLQTMFAALKDTLSEFLLQEKRIRINGLLYCGLEGLYTLVFGGCLVGSFFLFLHTTASASAQVPGQGVLATATANCTIGNITGGTFDNDSAGVGVIMDGMSHLSAIFARISSDVLLASFLSVYALIVLMMNLFNTFSIKRNSAVTRCMWKCLRVLGVWLVELIVHCLVPAVSIPSSSAPPPSSSSSSPSYTHPNVLEFGEGWSGQSFAKLVGLILIVIAMYIYYLGKGQ